VTGIVAALLAELLLVLLLLTLSPDVQGPKGERRTVFSMEPERAATEREEQPAKPAAKPAPSTPRATPDTPQPPLPPAPAMPITPPPSVAVIPMTSEQMAAADITPRAPSPPAPRRQVAGPPDTGGGSAFADTLRVEGSGPNGEPLYAAAWYREPYPEELRGYLSTARGPGSALIACRTVREWRVDDCILLGENPEGSNIGRAVLAAAWQFKVRPPRLGGELKYGEWVRIRIDYTQR
jgi:protein TonB